MRQVLKQLMIFDTLFRPAIMKYLDEVKQLPPEDVFLTIREACEFLYMAERTLRRKKESGEIACIKIGKKIFFSKAELTRYKKANGIR